MSVPLHVAGSYEAELQNIAPDPERLRRLAESTGGELLRLDQIPRLPDRLADVADNRPRISELSLWDSPYLFVFVVACFGAEWGLRKRFRPGVSNEAWRRIGRTRGFRVTSGRGRGKGLFRKNPAVRPLQRPSAVRATRRNEDFAYTLRAFYRPSSAMTDPTVLPPAVRAYVHGFVTRGRRLGAAARGRTGGGGVRDVGAPLLRRRPLRAPARVARLVLLVTGCAASAFFVARPLARAAPRRRLGRGRGADRAAQPAVRPATGHRHVAPAGPARAPRVGRDPRTPRLRTRPRGRRRRRLGARPAAPRSPPVARLRRRAPGGRRGSVSCRN